MDNENNEKLELYKPVILNNQDFNRLSKYIMNRYGIKMPPMKKLMVQSRLQKRLKYLKFKNFTDYINYVFSNKGRNEELVKMIDAITTNKTEFFREKTHFDFLYSQGIDDFLNKTGKKYLSIWSAGCSSGEEPYSIAITLKEYCRQKRTIDFSVVASDISSEVLETAHTGIYQKEKITNLSQELRKKYLLRGKDIYQNKIRIAKEIRNTVIFQRFNLVTDDFSGLRMFDIIFCRNVLIYFERELQYKILLKFINLLNSGGYLFLGHSESITGFSLPVEQIKPSIYRKIS